MPPAAVKTSSWCLAGGVLSVQRLPQSLSQPSTVSHARTGRSGQRRAQAGANPRKLPILGFRPVERYFGEDEQVTGALQVQRTSHTTTSSTSLPVPMSRSTEERIALVRDCVLSRTM